MVPNNNKKTTMNSKIIFQNLLFNEAYTRKVLPFLKLEYFNDKVDKEIFYVINSYAQKYHSPPTVEVLEAAINQSKKFTQDEFNLAKDLISEFKKPFKQPELLWLVDETETFCADSSIYSAVVEAIAIINDENSKTPKTAIPDLLRDALAITFNTEVGHDYLADVSTRFKKLHENTARIPFDIHGLNKATGGGLPRKTIAVFMGGPGAGKSLVMTHIGSSMFKAGSNVLYVTLELAEERIGERIDANLLNLMISDIPNLPIDTYEAKIKKVSDKTGGARFFIKEYPPASITPAHLRALLDELKMKKNFTPDVVIVDYLNLMNSSRFKAGTTHNSYTIMKAVTEELRGLAVEREIVLITATQSNRSGLGSSDLDMGNVSESLGIVMTADLLVGITRNEELDNLKQVLFKILKTRFSDLTNYRFVSGIDLPRMKLFDVDSKAQTNIQQTDSNQENKNIYAVKPKQDKYSGFKT